MEVSFIRDINGNIKVDKLLIRFEASELEGLNRFEISDLIEERLHALFDQYEYINQL